ncbi:MAG: single-stranded-DNA-specific exonuclease RecJ [Clostridia bacterium]|nr:single-stranded-DNA-specific exonuclease RecJ [Clostridia bacterium]
MIKSREWTSKDEMTAENLSARLGVSFLLAKMLVVRGIKDEIEARSFLEPRKADLFDPYLLSGMKEAVERITLARDEGQTVVIYGDYDADGISAVTVLRKCLKIFGLDTYAVIPERENGYGLTAGVYEQVLEAYNPDLIITVDCGISAVNEVEDLKDLGVDVIITDHHEIPDRVPDCTIINCHIKDDYPFEYLCGAGVAYKLGRALIGEKADAFLDMVALATVADSMPLVGENRILVCEGLKALNSGRAQKCLKALAEACKTKEFTAIGLSYTLAPRVNAAGRMGDAYSALKLFTSEDPVEMANLSKKLNDYNVKRQTECEELYKDAKRKLSDKGDDGKAIVLFDESWKAGLIGIVAARLVEEYKKPVILFGEKDGFLHGSARSIGGINVFQALSAVQTEVEAFGGHAQAAGVTVNKEKFADFERALNGYLSEKFTIADFKFETEVDWFLDEPFTPDFAKELEKIEPCGVGNAKPSFAVRCSAVNASPIKYGSPHLSFSTPFIDLLWFGGLENASALNSPVEKIVVFEPNLSVFNGRQSLKGYVRSVETVAEATEGLIAAIVDGQLSKPQISGGFTSIDTKKAQAFLDEGGREIYGTLFIVNNPENLEKYEGLGQFEFCSLKLNRGGNVNTVCLGFAGEIPSSYKRVVYLDEPLSIDKTQAEVFVNTSLKGIDAEKLAVNREIVGKVFNGIKRGNILSAPAAEVAIKNQFGCSPSQAVVALKILSELKVIKKENNFIRIDEEKRTDISLSPTFRRISSLVGENVSGRT